MSATYGAKFRQPLQYGSDEHTDLYNTLRQSQEGLHGFAKDDAHEALAAPGKRRVRGKVAQSLFTAFLLAAASIRKIRTFLANPQEDEHGAVLSRDVHAPATTPAPGYRQELAHQRPRLPDADMTNKQPSLSRS